MQDATVLSDLHSPHIGGDLPTITSEPTGPPGNNEPTVHDVPTGPLIDTPPVAGAQSPLPLSGPRAQQRTFLPQRGVYYAVIAGVIAGVFNALLTIVVILVNAGTFHAASQQIAVDRLTVKTALALAAWELLNFTLSLLVGFCRSHLLHHYILGEPHLQLSRQPRSKRDDPDDWESRDRRLAALSLEHRWGTREPVRNMDSDREASSLYEARRVAWIGDDARRCVSTTRLSPSRRDVLYANAPRVKQAAFRPDR